MFAVRKLQKILTTATRASPLILAITSFVISAGAGGGTEGAVVVAGARGVVALGFGSTTTLVVVAADLVVLVATLDGVDVDIDDVVVA